MSELTKLYQAFVEDSALRSIAMMACSVMQPLLLQKTQVSEAGPGIILAALIEGLIFMEEGVI